MKLISPALSCLLLLLLFQPASGAETCGDFADSRCRIEIEMHKSFLKRTEEPITRVSVADPAIADIQLLTPRQVLVVSRENPGRTDLILWHGDDDAQVYEVLVYAPGRDFAGYVRQHIERIVPEAAVQVHNAGNGEIILSGEVQSQETLDRVLSLAESLANKVTNLILVRGTMQVQLEVKIAEVSRSGMKQMGLGFLVNKDWSVGVIPSGSVSAASGADSTSALSNTRYRGGFDSRSVESGHDTGSRNVTESATDTQTGTTTGSVTDTLTDETFLNRLSQKISENLVDSTEADTTARGLSSVAELTSPFASAFQVAVHALNDDAIGILSILKGQGLSRILAQPTLVTMNGQEAEFLVGGEFPVPVAGNEGEVTIEFKAFGVMLRFTPFVVGAETITLRVEPEVSSLDYSATVAAAGVIIPSIKSRRGATTLQLKNGQTFVMAGLLKDELYTVTNKIPLLGDIPYLGTLFTTREYKKDETELVIVVTPRLVRPLDADEVVPLPGEDMAGSLSDADFFLKNRSEPAKRSSGPVDISEKPAGFKGPLGFSE